MLSSEAIQNALHANRVVDLNIGALHGPLGLALLAEAVNALQAQSAPETKCPSETLTITLRAETRQKLEQMATSHDGTRPMQSSAADLAAAIVERFVATAGE